MPDSIIADIDLQVYMRAAPAEAAGTSDRTRVGYWRQKRGSYSRAFTRRCPPTSPADALPQSHSFTRPTAASTQG
jgi:hypothetical protein